MGGFRGCIRHGEARRGDDLLTDETHGQLDAATPDEGADCRFVPNIAKPSRT